MTIEPILTFISVIGTTLVFQPKKVLNVGDYCVFIILIDPLNAFTKYSFDFKVRSLPMFVGKLPKKVEIISKQFKYQLPVSGNNDEYITHDAILPSFIDFSFPEYVFSPIKISDFGIFIIKGKLCNKYGSTIFSFNVNSTNQPP